MCFRPNREMEGVKHTRHTTRTAYLDLYCIPIMSAPNDALTWCSDALHDLLGFTDSALAQYLVDVAKKARSYREIVDVVQKGRGKGDRIDAESFAKDLFQRCNPKKSSNKQKQRSETREERKAASQDDSRRDTDTHKDLSRADQPTSRRKRHRRTSSDEDSSGDEDQHRVQRTRTEAERRREGRRGSGSKTASADAPQQQESKLSAEEQADLQREKDLRERDELSKRMLERDKSKTMNKAIAFSEEQQLIKEKEERLAQNREF